MVLEVCVKILPDCPFLFNGVFDDFILSDEPIGKALRSFEICVVVNNNLCGKLFSSLKSPTIFDERFKNTLVSFLLQILAC